MPPASAVVAPSSPPPPDGPLSPALPTGAVPVPVGLVPTVPLSSPGPVYLVEASVPSLAGLVSEPPLPQA